MIRIKRTREEINASIKDRSCCYLCGKKLRTVSVLRTSDKACSSCRGQGKSEKAGITKDHKDLKARKIEPSEDEMSFEDDPRALKEQDHQRYIAQPREQISYGTSALVDLMSPSTYYSKLYGSATDGTRYSYRKGKQS
mgnify:FL=1